MPYIEIIGTLLSLVYLWLSIQQKTLLWLFGLLSSALYVYIFAKAKFYADMSLQVYYVVISIYGWVVWALADREKTTNTNQQDAALVVQNTPWRLALVLAAIAALIWGLYYFILHQFTDSPLPIADSLTTALGIVATWMLARKYLQHWLIWIFVDTLSAGLYIWKGLYVTSILYIIYAVMAVIGYRQWKKSGVLAS